VAEYRRGLIQRRAREAEQLASLTGWSLADIRRKMGPDPSPQGEPVAWWEKLWKK